MPFTEEVASGGPTSGRFAGHRDTANDEIWVLKRSTSHVNNLWVWNSGGTIGNHSGPDFAGSTGESYIRLGGFSNFLIVVGKQEGVPDKAYHGWTGTPKTGGWSTHQATAAGATGWECGWSSGVVTHLTVPNWAPYTTGTTLGGLGWAGFGSGLAADYTQAISISNGNVYPDEVDSFAGSDFICAAAWRNTSTMITSRLTASGSANTSISPASWVSTDTVELEHGFALGTLGVFVANNLTRGECWIGVVNAAGTTVVNQVESGTVIGGAAVDGVGYVAIGTKLYSSDGTADFTDVGDDLPTTPLLLMESRDASELTVWADDGKIYSYSAATASTGLLPFGKKPFGKLAFGKQSFTPSSLASVPVVPPSAAVLAVQATFDTWVTTYWNTFVDFAENNKFNARRYYYLEYAISGFDNMYRATGETRHLDNALILMRKCMATYPWFKGPTSGGDGTKRDRLEDIKGVYGWVSLCRAAKSASIECDDVINFVEDDVLGYWDKPTGTYPSLRAWMLQRPLATPSPTGGYWFDQLSMLTRIMYDLTLLGVGDWLEHESAMRALFVSLHEFQANGSLIWEPGEYQGSTIVDCAHANRDVLFCVATNFPQTTIDGLVKTFTENAHTGYGGDGYPTFAERIDGSGPNDRCWLHEGWIRLAAYSDDVYDILAASWNGLLNGPFSGDGYFDNWNVDGWKQVGFAGAWARVLHETGR